MTIAYLTSLYARASDTFIRGEVAQLRALGHTVHTFSIRRPGAEEMVSDEVRRERAATEDILEAGGFRLAMAPLRELARSPRRFLRAAALAAKVGTPGIKGRLWPLLYLVEASYLAGRLRAKGVRHLHNHLGRNSAAVAMIASELAAIPHSLTVHGPTEFDEPAALALGEKVKRSAFTVAISAYGRSQLCRWSASGDWPKVRVVHCGVDPSFLRTPPSPPAEAPRLVTVGRLAEQKGQSVLIEAAALLRDRGIPFELTIVGDGPMRGAIERQVAESGLGDRVVLAGWRDAAGVRQALLESRVMVLPSFAEGLPVVLMEAMALGRPVVATYVAGIPELVRPGLEGWLVPPGSAEALADAMADALAADSETLAAMGRAGAQRVARRHDPAVEAAKLAALIANPPNSSPITAPPPPGALHPKPIPPGPLAPLSAGGRSLIPDETHP